MMREGLANLLFIIDYSRCIKKLETTDRDRQYVKAKFR